VNRPTLSTMLALLSLLTALGGCGGRPALAPVSGRVVFRDGRPVAAGVIEFAPVSGGPAARSTISRTGQFALTTDGRPGALVGEHRVAVIQTALLDGHAKHVRQHAGLPIVHRKFRRFETSGLTRVVSDRAANEFVIAVDPEP